MWWQLGFAQAGMPCHSPQTVARVRQGRIRGYLESQPNLVEIPHPPPDAQLAYSGYALAVYRTLASHFVQTQYGTDEVMTQ